MQVGPGVTEPWTCPCIRVLHNSERNGPYTASLVVMTMMRGHTFLKYSTIVVLEHQSEDYVDSSQRCSVKNLKQRWSQGITI